MTEEQWLTHFVTTHKDRLLIEAFASELRLRVARTDGEVFAIAIALVGAELAAS